MQTPHTQIHAREITNGFKIPQNRTKPATWAKAGLRQRTSQEQDWTSDLGQSRSKTANSKREGLSQQPGQEQA